MKTLAKRYYHVIGCPKADEITHTINNNYVVADVYYDKGGYSYFSYKSTPRGYFMSVYRMGRYVTEDGYGMEVHTLFGNGGMKRMIKEVSRQTAKGDREAIEIYERDIEEFVREVFSDLELEEEV